MKLSGICGVKTYFVTSLFASASYGAALLLNGAQSALLPNATTDCLNAFNTTLNCPSQVQKLGFHFNYANFKAADFTVLCTTACATSLKSLKASVRSACGTYSFDFNAMQMSAVQVVDMFYYKYNMSCLMSTETGKPCLLQEKTWNITKLQQSGNITWPSYTNKTYPDLFVDPGSGDPAVDVNGTLIADPFSNSYTLYSFPDGLPATAIDIYTNGTAIYNANAGYSSMLEFDEYPLEIQCQSCFINQFTTSVQSQWGETYDSVMSQIWKNMKKNCNLTQTIVAAHNVTSGLNDAVLPNYKTICPQKITLSGTNNTCSSVAVANNIESASLIQLNSAVTCFNVTAGTYCATQSCQSATVSSTTSVGDFLNSASAPPNMTMYEFQGWNPLTNSDTLYEGDVVCIGPPGGAYVPSSTVSQAYPTVFTTTASPAAPTPSGTVSNCGSYYLVHQGDICNSVALNKSITFDTLVNLNPSLDCQCSNLLIGLDYCVAPVQGTDVQNVTCTNPPTGTSTLPPSACSKYVAPPTQTVDGTTAKCCTWYTTQANDTCDKIDQTYNISLDQFRAWNTYINAQCTNLFLGYGYCVLSDVPVSPSAGAKAALVVSNPSRSQKNRATTAGASLGKSSQ